MVFTFPRGSKPARFWFKFSFSKRISTVVTPYGVLVPPVWVTCLSRWQRKPTYKFECKWSPLRMVNFYTYRGTTNWAFTNWWKRFSEPRLSTQEREEAPPPYSLTATLNGQKQQRRSRWLKHTDEQTTGVCVRAAVAVKIRSTTAAATATTRALHQESISFHTLASRRQQRRSRRRSSPRTLQRIRMRCCCCSGSCTRGCFCNNSVDLRTQTHGDIYPLWKNMTEREHRGGGGGEICVTMAPRNALESLHLQAEPW